MRRGLSRTRALPALAIIFAAVAGTAAEASRPNAAQAQTAPASRPTTASEDVGARLAEIDAALAQERWALALERVRAAGGAASQTPAFQFRAAQAYFRLGQVLGASEVRTVPSGRAGQFTDRWLLVEPQAEAERFLCCPPDSALYQLRQALDGGLDEPAAHVLHARIWQRLGRPQVGLAVLKARAAVLLAKPDDSVLRAYSDLALDAGELSGYLRYERRRAELDPARRDDILFGACLTAAERYNRAGQEKLYIEWLHRAGQIRPDDTDLMLRLADAEWSGGEPTQAAPLYQKVLKLRPDHPQRERILERLADAQPPPAP